MSQDYPARDQERRPLIGLFSRAVRAGSRKPGSAPDRPAPLRRLVPAAGATYHARAMPEIGCKRVGLFEGWSETVAPSSGRCDHSYSGRKGPANIPSGDVLLRS